MERKECSVKAEVLADLDFQSTPFEIFQNAAGLDELLDIIVVESNKYANQNGRNFETTKEEIQAFLGINFVMAINKLPCIGDYWSTDKFLGNEAIRNIMTRTRFQAILQNLHFADNQEKDNSDKTFKIQPIIQHFNKVFAATLGNSTHQNIDEHMCTFKGKSSMKQYI